MYRHVRIAMTALAVSLMTLVTLVTPVLFAQSQMATIEGEVTGMDTESDPPRLAVRTFDGRAYILRAPDRASVVPAQVGSYFMATGTASGETFNAATLEVGEPGQRPVRPLAGGIVATVVGLDTQSAPARIVVQTDSGERFTVLSPGPAPLGHIQIGSRITAVGTRQGDTYLASDLRVLGTSEPVSVGIFDDNDNGGSDDDNDNS